mmetsp:Transcript_36677/g.84591  ORF Transcript_36677/g.84591 Transcript_36677/m.84591 type:complete len:218 (-) Transcript_36677:266-919(-)
MLFQWLILVLIGLHALPEILERRGGVFCTFVIVVRQFHLVVVTQDTGIVANGFKENDPQGRCIRVVHSCQVCRLKAGLKDFPSPGSGGVGRVQDTNGRHTAGCGADPLQETLTTEHCQTLPFLLGLGIAGGEEAGFDACLARLAPQLPCVETPDSNSKKLQVPHDGSRQEGLASGWQTNQNQDHSLSGNYLRVCTVHHPLAHGLQRLLAPPTARHGR